ncbi:MAG: DUF1622 domain-containing protein [Anaerolineales bacterium]|jgi:uncharacterized membrane protein
MLNLPFGSETGAGVLDWIELTSLAIEVLAVVIIVVSVLYGTARFILRSLKYQLAEEERYTRYKHTLGRALLLGLEILVAADVVRTVALEATLQSVAVLGLLVFIRTFLSWSLVVEIEGRWPWQPERPGLEAPQTGHE